MSVLVEIEFDGWSDTHKLTAGDVEHLKRFSITPVETRKDDETRLDYNIRPIIPVSALSAIQHRSPRIVRVIDNDGTRSLVESGQRNTTVINERCSVAVAGLGLLTVNEVENHDDLCTEALQKKLDDGWHILAVCVQPDQRRPDYILGRTQVAS